MFPQVLHRYIITLLILLTFLTGFPNSADALLRQHQDAPGVMRYHSQVSIKDDLGYSWQVVLFKLFLPGEPTSINLRLVGFPGVVEFTHPQSLEILTAKGKLLTAADVYAEKSPAPNVGEYRFTDVLNTLSSTERLKLFLPLRGVPPLVLKIPEVVVLEWQWLVTDVN
ncbi:MAG: DUF3122 domain-containing protein [Nostocaceae cyanobacterium]|nr:DUF3122 domain-containing protein [Nostocaceae cyanobacterium]